MAKNTVSCRPGELAVTVAQINDETSVLEGALCFGTGEAYRFQLVPELLVALAQGLSILLEGKGQLHQLLIASRTLQCDCVIV